MVKKRTGAPSLREALEEALVANPDDVATHAAHADFLMEQDAPADRALGELIRTQLTLEDESLAWKERKSLEKRERELLDGHRQVWLGELARALPAPEDCGVEFRRGWLHCLHAGYLMIDLARALARAPQTRLLRELTISSGQLRPHGFVAQP